MLRRSAPLIVMVFLISLVATACVVRTHPGHRGQTVYVRDHDNGKHKKAPKPPKKHKDDHGHDD